MIFIEHVYIHYVEHHHLQDDLLEVEGQQVEEDVQ